ncbi:MAG: hypothetical protein HOW73_10585 [Polyangiaceae bacterium]|nr:hypothetical protein [Polyangiaceae bacterium]
MRTHSTFLWLATPLLLVAVACGDDTSTGGSGGSGGSDGGAGGSDGEGGDPVEGGGGGSGGEVSVGGAGGAGGEGGAGGAEPFMPPTPFAVPLSAAGPDQLQSVAPAEDGKFFAAGFAAQAVGGPRAVVVVKFSPMGPDNTFGTGGVAITSTPFAGGNDEIDITTQSDGKVLVSATIADADNPADRDIAILRLGTDGTPDATFGTDGVAAIDLNQAHDNGTMLVGLDAARSITVDADDNIFVHAVSRGLGLATGGGPRTDTDFTVVKLTPDGAVDAGFGEGGQFRLDIQEANATSRGIKALADGSLLVGGYANTPDLASTQPVLYKLTADGDLDTEFANEGVFHEAVLATQTEVYNFALHGDRFVTAGYGRNTGETNDYVSLRFDVATGDRDTTWGGAPNGAVVIDPSGAMLGSNARNAIGLPDGKTIIIGSTGPGNMPAQDAVFVVLDENGALDTKYGTGITVLKLGNDGNDQFWGGAVSGNFVALVGYQGGGMDQTDTTNDDAYGVVFEIQ